MTYELNTLDGRHHTIGQKWSPIECFRCGLCCVLYRPKVRPEEIKVIARELGLPEHEFMIKYVRNSPSKNTKLLQNKEDQCPFLTLKQSVASCTIYSVRPLACRNWQASLSRQECREGLTKINNVGSVLSLDKLCSSATSVRKLIQASSMNVDLKSQRYDKEVNERELST